MGILNTRLSRGFMWHRYKVQLFNDISQTKNNVSQSEKQKTSGGQVIAVLQTTHYGSIVHLAKQMVLSWSFLYSPEPS